MGCSWGRASATIGLQEPGLSASVVPLSPLLGAIASLVVGALFAASDTAITSLTSSRLEALLEQAEGADKDVYRRIQEHDAKLRSRYLLGRIASTAVTAVCMLEVFLPSFPEAAGWLALATTVIVTSVAFELTTTVARKYADRAALWAARWMRPLEIAMLPLAVPLGWLGARMAERGGEQPADPRVTEAEVEALVDEGERAGVFAGEPAEIIRNVLDFAERTAKDAMIPRSRVDAIDIATPIPEVLRTVAESGHSRYPVYKEQIDNVLGLLYAKDLYKAVTPLSMRGDPDTPRAQPGDGGAAAKKLEDILRTPANFVSESQPLASLLREMRWRRQHLAIVVDEFGSVSGIVTLEDVLAEIVGEIHSEHERTIQDLGGGRVIADAGVSMKELFTHLGAALPPEPEESVEGMLTLALGKVPAAGTALNRFGLRFIVRSADDKHVGKVEVVRG
jgi:CBS domain containing-hemolysin-like protein